MYQKLHPGKLGLAGGLIWSLTLFLMSLLAMYTGWAMFWISQWIDLYPGFNFSFKGILIGLIYAFIHGFLAWYILAKLYNYFLKKNR